jgi:hypothetical protein
MTACTQPGCTSTIVDNYCEVCGSPAGAAPFVPAEVAASAASPAPAKPVHRESGFPAEPKTAGLMMACTQPGCTGMIVDGYCDVCGSPAGAVPFFPAVASAVSPAPADAPGLTEVRREPGFPQKQKSGNLMTACTQQGCTGMIVDGYCDVCGSPAGAVPFVPAAASAASPASADEPGLTAAPAPRRVPAPTDEEIPTQRIPRVQVDTILDLPWSTETPDWIDIQGSREVEATLRRLIEPAVADVEEGATAEAEPPAVDVEGGATAEAEPVVADVEEGATAAVEPVVADVEEGDTAEGEPPASDIEKADTGPAGLQDDDTVRMPAVPAVLSGGRHLRPQLPEQQVLGPEPVQTPAKKRRFGYLALAAAALAALLIGALLFAASSRDRGATARSVPTVTATATATVTKPTSEPSNGSTDTGGEGRTIQLEDLADSARSFQTVRIEGMYRGGPDTFMQVQRWEGGQWLAFPLPTKTDQSGRFTAFVEFGQPGRYRLRVVDPDSGVMSKTFVLVITG